MVSLGKFRSVGVGSWSVWVSLGRFMVVLGQFGSVHGRVGSVWVGSWSGWVGSWSVWVSLGQFGSVHGRFGSVWVGSWSCCDSLVGSLSGYPHPGTDPGFSLGGGGGAKDYVGARTSRARSPKSLTARVQKLLGFLMVSRVI